MILPYLGHQLHPRSDDSAEEESPPRDWSYRLWPRPIGMAGTRWGGLCSHVPSSICSMAQAPTYFFTPQPSLRTQSS